MEYWLVICGRIAPYDQVRLSQMISVSDRMEMLSSLKWYFESKNLSLRSALGFRAPLLATEVSDMRLHYSQYFANLGSATELLLEKERTGSKRFKEILESHFVFNGFPDGEANYRYVHELRNSIVHRGLDICAAAHIRTDFPLVLAPVTVSHRFGKKTHHAFGKYLLTVIANCEQAVGPAVAKHLAELGVLEPDLTQDELAEYAKDGILMSTAMPDDIKNMALDKVDNVDHCEVHLSFVKGVAAALLPNAVPSIELA